MYILDWLTVTAASNIPTWPGFFLLVLQCFATTPLFPRHCWRFYSRTWCRLSPVRPERLWRCVVIVNVWKETQCDIGDTWINRMNMPGAARSGEWTTCLLPITIFDAPGFRRDSPAKFWDRLCVLLKWACPWIQYIEFAKQNQRAPVFSV